MEPTMDSGDGQTENQWHGLPAEQWFGADGGTAADPADEHRSGGAGVPALATLACDEGLLTQDQVREAVDEGLRSGERLGEVLLRLGWLDERQLACLIARQRGLPYIDAVDLPDDPVATVPLPREQARELGAVVVGFEEDRPVIALADPSDDRVAGLRSVFGGAFTCVVVTKSTLDWLLARDVSEDERTSAAVDEVGAETVAPPVTNPERSLASQEAPRTGPSDSGSEVRWADTSAHDVSAQLLDQLEQADTLLRGLRLRFEDLQERNVAAAHALAACNGTIERLQTELAERDARLERLKSTLTDLGTAI